MLHIEISKALKRKFDSLTGKEIDPNYGKDKKVSTGYLMSSYKTSASTDSDKIDAAEAKRMITVTELTRLTENKLPETGNVISQAFWCAEEDIEKMELLQGDPVRLKTKGEGPFIEFIVKLDNAGSVTAANYTGGEGAGSSWTDKVMSFKGQQDVPQDEGDGVEDDEWDD